jgi:hypothetical protein
MASQEREKGLIAPFPTSSNLERGTAKTGGRLRQYLRLKIKKMNIPWD